MKSGRSILYSIFLMIFIGITLFTVGISYWVWINVKQERLTDLAHTASILDRYYSITFSQRELSLLSVGKTMLDIQGDDFEARRYKFATDALKVYSDLLAFGLATPEGQLITFTGAKPGEILPNLSESSKSERSFLEAKVSQGISIGEVYYFDEIADWMLPIRVPITNAEGELIALNTSAIKYESLKRDLKSFGLLAMYRVHFINATFNTTQIYYPLEKDKYGLILHQNPDIYSDTLNLSSTGELTFFEGFNQLEKNDVIGVITRPASLRHYLIVSVDKKIIWIKFWQTVRFVGLAYLVLLAMTLVAFNYLRGKEKQYSIEKIAEKKLLQREANLKSLFESTNSVIGLFDANKRLIEYNRSFAYYTRRAGSLSLHKGIDLMKKFEHPAIDKIQKFLDRALSGEKFTETLEFPVDQELSYLLFSFNPIYQEDKITGASMFVENITALKVSQGELEKYSEKLEYLVNIRTEELASTNIDLQSSNAELRMTLADLHDAQDKLIQAEKMASLGVLSAGIAHEINNPLNFIKGGIHALENYLGKKDEGVDKEILPYFQAINEGVKRASDIIKSLSHFSRQGTGMKETCDMHEIIDNCLVMLHNKTKNKVNIIKQYMSGPPVVIGNEGKLHQAFLNILVNAEQAIDHGGKITIKTEINSKQVVISFGDSGIGIEKENLSKISDLFYTTKAPGIGTGLGLSITYSIIQEHKGSIEVSSKLMKGTKFIIRLPIS